VRPSLSKLDDFIAEGREIPVFLDKLAELELHAATGQTWLQKAAEAFLIDPSHSLITVSLQNYGFEYLFNEYFSKLVELVFLLLYFIHMCKIEDY